MKNVYKFKTKEQAQQIADKLEQVDNECNFYAHGLAVKCKPHSADEKNHLMTSVELAYYDHRMGGELSTIAGERFYP